MVTSSHEASHRIFQDRPELLTPVFQILGVGLAPKASIEALTPDTTELRPLERRVDSVLRVTPSEGTAFLLAIEAQGRRDPDKGVSWMYYLGYLMAKYGMPALLLVVCQDRRTARWAAGPFDAGVDHWHSVTTRPLVLGPDNVPVITNPDEAARNLAMAAFSAMTHGRDRDTTAILEALARALGTADTDSVAYYSELLEVGLGDTPARKTWRKLMSVGSFFPGRGTLVEETFLKGKAEGEAEGEAKGKAEGKAEGEAKGKAEAVLRVLAARGIEVPEATARRISSCTDTDVLDTWLDRAITATDTEELFAGEPAGQDLSDRSSDRP
ncbi:hypothetical protein Q5762_14805 [Streptomyces sp. P9(2023)]|uniref:hypothetical protein n=1 Tax=Streptomyces sp. P9(2023) TaxID=3064394 RepID=UPI0028F43FA3|nr:hypothetical protein [Streptomyces sp. P9(2023)]MDT9689584.1 hypothetical protein [Streptomyces sp. P9(2023)]